MVARSEKVISIIYVKTTIRTTSARKGCLRLSAIFLDEIGCFKGRITSNCRDLVKF